MYEKPFDPSKPKIVAGPPPAPSASSKNALKHGCCANNTLLIPGESEEDLKALEVIWLKTYNPTSEAERHLVQELAHADWFLQRATRSYNDVESGLYKSNPSPAEWTEQQDRKLGRYLRYKTAHTNNVIRCQKRIEDFRKARLAEKSAEMRDQAEAMGYVPPGTPNPFPGTTPPKSQIPASTRAKSGD